MTKLAHIFEGWNGYQISLLHAVSPLTAPQLAWRPAADRRSAGALIRHLTLGGITWFARLGVPVFPGHTMTYTGRVTGVRRDGDEGIVEVEFTAIDDLGEHVSGTATLSLPA